MKKLLFLLIILSISLVTFVVFASENIVFNRAELVEKLRTELESGKTQIEITYQTSDEFSGDFAREVFKDAIASNEYLKNNYSSVGVSYARNESYIVYKWNITYRTTAEQEVEIAAFVNREGTKIKNTTSNQFEQVRLVNKLLMEKATYSLNGINVGSAYGIVSDGNVVCHGYTMMALKLFEFLGIENKIVIGYDNKGVKHSWNLVSINNEWFHVDVTYNDTSKLVEGFLLKSDSYMTATRSWNYYAYPKAYSDYNKAVLYVSAENKIYPTEVKTPEVKVSDEIYRTEEKVVESWSETVIKEAANESIVINGDLKSNITREAFVTEVMELYTRYSNSEIVITKVFNDTNNTEVLKAYNIGIINGTGENMFSPNRFITREEAAVIIYRLLNVLGISGNMSNVYISDLSSVSTWAVEPIKFLMSNNIMNGYGNGVIDPKGTLTTEQAVALIYKTNEFIK